MMLPIEDVPREAACSALEQKARACDGGGGKLTTLRLRDTTASRLRDFCLVRVARVDEVIHVLVKFIVRFLINVDHVPGVVIGEADILAN